MPANPTVLNSGSKASATHAEKSRQALIKGSKRVNHGGHDVLDAEHKVDNVTAALKQYEEKNSDLLNVHSSVVMKYIVAIVALCCVYCLDVLLFGATAEYVASLISGNWIIVLIAKYGVPLFFLGVEVLCSVKMIEARDAHEMQKENEEVPSYGW